MQQHAPSVRPVQHAPQLLLPLQPAAAQPPPAACVPAQLLPAALHDVSALLPLPSALLPVLLLFVLLLRPCPLVQHGPSCHVLLWQVHRHVCVCQAVQVEAAVAGPGEVAAVVVAAAEQAWVVRCQCCQHLQQLWVQLALWRPVGVWMSEAPAQQTWLPQVHPTATTTQHSMPCGQMCKKASKSDASTCKAQPAATRKVTNEVSLMLSGRESKTEDFTMLSDVLWLPEPL